MACNSTYLEPTRREKELQRAARLYARNLADWWEEHQRADAERVASEERDRQKRIARLEQELAELRGQ